MSETPQVDVDIVVPVKNEEHDLEPSVTRLVEHLRCAFPFSARVTIADNGSTDGTWPAACALEAKYPEVRAVHLDIPGRGRALHQIWSSSDAEVLAYMDVDLSTDLNALLPLVAPLLSGHSDVAIGSRLARGSRVVRGPKREIISRSYNLLLRTDPRRRVLRRAVRVQGDQGRPGQAAAAAGRGQGLVLRHRAAGAGRAGRAAHPRGAGGLDRRRGLAGQHRRHRARRPARDDASRPRSRPRARSRSRSCARPASGRRAGSRGRCLDSRPSARPPRWPTSWSSWRCAGSWARRPPTR